MKGVRAGAVAEGVPFGSDAEFFFGLAIGQSSKSCRNSRTEERRQVREWLDAEDFAETDELIAAVDEGFRSSETEQSLSVEEVRELIRRCATRSK